MRRLRRDNICLERKILNCLALSTIDVWIENGVDPKKEIGYYKPSSSYTVIYTYHVYSRGYGERKNSHKKYTNQKAKGFNKSKFLFKISVFECILTGRHGCHITQRYAV